MREAMKELFGLVRRPWGVYYIKNKATGEQTSLKTSDKAEAQRLLQARNDSENQPHFNLALARVYMNGSDPKLGTRTCESRRGRYFSPPALTASSPARTSRARDQSGAFES